MHEYKLMDDQNTANVQAPIDPMKLDEWVLCSIYENLSSDKREKRKRNAAEELDTRTEKRALVVQEPQSQINEDKANDQFVASSCDSLDQKEPIHDASDIGLMSDSDFAQLMEKMATEEVGIKRGERNAVEREQHQSVVFSADYLEDIISWDIPPMSDSDFAALAKLMEVMTGEEVGEINVVQQGTQINISENEDNDQSVLFSYDDLQNVPILDASDILSWDIPDIGDSNFDGLAELMRAGEELDTRSEITVVQQGPQIKTGENMFFSNDDLQKLPILDASDMVGGDIPPMSDSDFTEFPKVMEKKAGEELDTSKEITAVQQGPQIKTSENKDIISYDDLQKGPIDASDIVGCDIPPTSDADFASFVELMKKLTTPKHDSSSRSSPLS